jgi:hypothetical protein
VLEDLPARFADFARSIVFFSGMIELSFRMDNQATATLVQQRLCQGSRGVMKSFPPADS